ncbi:MAG TPA: hemolysin family protein [Sporichthyaceae bacterium]|jgi:CBS domain containing-hemolysin-like protein|nr:hemolysin family protein [Sporichthyaceae bacterium]
MGDAAGLAVAFLLVVANGLFVAAEFSLLTVSRTAVEQAAKDGDAGAAGVLRALRTLTTQLSGVQVGITLTSLAIGFLAEPSVANLFRPRLLDWGASASTADAIAATLGLALSTVATMVLGELVPQYLALAHPVGVARAVQRPLRLFTFVTRPISGGLNIVANRMVGALGVEPTAELASARNPEELVYLVQRSAEEGAMQNTTAELLRKVLTFDEKHAWDVMTPRTRVTTVGTADSVAELIEIARESGRSRFPVLGQSVDDVRGVVSLLDAWAVPAARRDTTRVGEITKPAHFVPSVLPVDDLLAGLLLESAQLAIVLDEFGGLDGVVSLEDLLEELVGEVLDEHDTEPDRPTEDRTATTWTLSGLLRPDEVRDITGVELPDDSAIYETLAGLIMSSLGRVPHAGDEVTVAGVHLRVLAMDGRRVDQVEVRRPAPDPVEAQP